MTITFSECSTVYLNRDCHRSCPQCSNKRPGMITLNGRQWCEVFDKMQDIFGTKFFLILGLEPLLMPRDDLYSIIDYFKQRTNLAYAFYTTLYNPEKLNDLFSRGLRNISCGIDSMPDSDQKSNSAIKIFDLAYSNPNVTELHALITIQKSNLAIVPSLIKYLCNRYTDKIHIGLNYIEHGDGFDFDFAPVDFEGHFQEVDRSELERFVSNMSSVYKEFGNSIQTPYAYLKDIDDVISLNRACNMVMPCVEADGSLRKCGYRTGFNLPKINILEVISQDYNNIRDLYIDNVRQCRGCYWAYPYIVGTEKDLVEYRSKLWEDRKNVR